MVGLLNFDRESEGCTDAMSTGNLNLTSELVGQLFTDVQTKTDTVEVVWLAVLENTVWFKQLRDVLGLDTDASVFDKEHEGLGLDLVRVKDLDETSAGELDRV